MPIHTEILHQAIRRVEHEQSSVRTELRCFEKFRKAVSQTPPDPSDWAATSESESSKKLKNKYEELVIDATDFEQAYDETLEENLKAEFTSRLATVLLSHAPLTQKWKRDLLIQTNAAIKRREKLLKTLDDEREQLERTSEDVANIQSTIEILPSCSPDEHTLDELLKICNKYNNLERRCQQLLDERQQHFDQANHFIQRSGMMHGLNEYLYNDLGAQYPVLSVLADTLEAISKSQKGSKAAAHPTQ